MKRHIALMVGALAVVGSSTAVIAGSGGLFSAASASGSSCTFKGTAKFSPPLSLNTQKVNVTVSGTLSACGSNTYGITGGTVKASGSGDTTCNPDTSLPGLTTSGTIVWKGVKGTNDETSTSTGVPGSSPPEDTLSGTITGGSPVPAGTPTGGMITYKVTKKLTAQCEAGTLAKSSFSGTTTLS
ncbi:MAG TPA: hypothetical protein VEJ87_06490 [Acidimicrobiales bacterium]|nr:hypothetical protein [Acidimicrobiales bacterium]